MSETNRDGAGCAPMSSTGGIDRFRLDELLEQLWYQVEEGEAPEEARLLERIDDPSPQELLDEALRLSLVRREGSGRLAWCESGEARARGVVRRHRLAEILFSQVLEVPDDEIEPNACEMEHILSTGVTDSVCTFLGHPPRCPHGRAIPTGACCATFAKTIEPIVVPLTDLDIGREGAVVFISTRGSARLSRLADLGILPGARTRLVQRHPSFVIQVAETTLALEKDIVREIYVRREAAPETPGGART